MDDPTSAGVRLAELSWQEAELVLSRRPIGLLPVGAIEVHGPHLPLNTDVIISEEMALRSATRLRQRGLDVLVLPPINYGVSFVGTSFAGTSPVERDALRGYVASLLIHLSSQGYGVLCICNAHLEPAHVESLQAAVTAAQAQADIPIVFPDKREDRWAQRLSDEFRRGARHAGSYETSLMLAARPEQVRVPAMKELPPVWIDLPARLRGGARTFVDAGGTLGYFGDPASASAEEGEILFSSLASMVEDTILETLGRQPE